METNTLRNAAVSKILIWFGIIIFIISSIDLLDIIIPLRLSSPEWVFGITQGIITSILVPALSIILALTGLYFAENSSTNKKSLLFEKFISIITFIIGLLLIANLLIYSLSMKSYETKVISSIQMQKEDTLNKINQFKKAPQFNIPDDVFNKKIAEINKAAEMQTKMAKKELLIKNVKSLIELFLYIALYLGIGKFAFDSAKNSSLKLKFANK